MTEQPGGPADPGGVDDDLVELRRQWVAARDAEVPSSAAGPKEPENARDLPMTDSPDSPSPSDSPLPAQVDVVFLLARLAQ